eukprot:jgi/Tetstr1/423015/TSEL_013790.t1
MVASDPAAAAVAVAGAEGKAPAGSGRRLVATRDVAAGEVVLTEAPFAAALLDEEVARRCHHTFQPGDKMLRCSASKFGRFGSRAAQAAAWAEGFREECAALVACAPRVPPPTIRLAARVEWRAARGAEGAAAVEGLLHHWEQLPEERKLTYAQMAALLREYCGKGSPESAPAEADMGEDTRRRALLLARLACNVMSICDEELRPIGVGLYLTAAMANHSCQPNCAQTFDGKRLLLRALNPIRAGEEVTISYIELAATRQERRASLLQQYYFDLDGPGAPPGPATGQAAQPPGMSAEEPRPGLLLSKTQAAVAPWRTDPMDADLTQVDADGDRLLMHGALVQEDKPPLPSDGFDIEEEGRGGGMSGHRETAGAEAEAGAGAGEDTADPLGALGRVALYCVGQTGRSRAALGGALWLAGALRCEAFCSGLLKQGRAAEALQTVSTQLRRPAPNAASVGPKHIMRVRLMQLGLRAAVESGSWEAALATATALTPILEDIYPPSWPALGLHLATHAKLLAMDAHGPAVMRAALQAAEKAVTLLRVTHGQASGIYKEMDTLRCQLGMEMLQA